MSRIRRVLRVAKHLASIALTALAALAELATAGCRARPAPSGPCKVMDQLVCDGHDRALVCEAVPANGSALGSPAPGASVEAAPGASVEAAPGAPDRTAAPSAMTSAAAGAEGALTRSWVSVPCKGTRGCGRTGDDDECDDTLATEGDACPLSPPLDYACAAGRSDALVCRDGRFDVWRHCRGPQGCQVVDGRNVHCDTSLGEADDPCERANTFACSGDGRTMLACDGKILVLASSCRGPKGCSFATGGPVTDAHRVDCDDGVALEGDPCTQDRRITCAVDLKAELACDGHTYRKKRDCRRSDCRIDGTELFCD